MRMHVKAGQILDGGRSGSLYRFVAEGMCPHHQKPLDRRYEGMGWCEECDLGYSTDNERVTLHAIEESHAMITGEVGATVMSFNLHNHLASEFEVPTDREFRDGE